MQPITGPRLPAQSPPISRKRMPGAGHKDATGVQLAATACDKLTGLAQQMCYATLGVNI